MIRIRCLQGSAWSPGGFLVEQVQAIFRQSFPELGGYAERIPPVYPDTFPIRRRARRPRELPVQAGYYCLDAATPLDRNAYTAARAAVDVAVTAAEEVLHGSRAAYALCRPPGHHAEPAAYGGFCYFNNAAVAAHRLSVVVSLGLDTMRGDPTGGFVLTAGSLGDGS